MSNASTSSKITAAVHEALEARTLLATIYVDDTGNDGSGTPSNPATPYATIQKAASVVQPGDEVIVLPGVYYGPITLTKTGTSSQPITFRADAVAQNRVIITNADRPIRENAAGNKWTLHDATRQIWKTTWNPGVSYNSSQPWHSFPSRVLYDGADLVPYKTLGQLQNFKLGPIGAEKMPGPSHGYTFDPLTNTLYVRLHATKYGRNGGTPDTNPNNRLMAVAPHVGHGGKGVDTFDSADQYLYNFGIKPAGPNYAAHVVLSGFSFETPGVSAVYVRAHNVTVKNSWFRGVRAGVSGGTTQNDRSQPTSLFNSQNVIVEYNNYSQYPTYDDAVDLLNLYESQADTDPSFPEFFWFTRKGQGDTIKDGNGNTIPNPNHSIYQAMDYETGGLTLRMGSNWEVRHNRVDNAFEGMSYLSMEHELGTPSQSGYLTYEMSVKIYENVFDRVVDNAIETENHGENIDIYRNEFIDVYQPISWQPLGGAPYPTNIYVHQNIAYLRDGTGAMWKNKSNYPVRWLKIGTQSNNQTVNLPEDGLVMYNNTVYMPDAHFAQWLNSTETNVWQYNNIFVVSDYSAGRAIPQQLESFYYASNVRAPGAAGEPSSPQISGTNGVTLSNPSAVGFADIANRRFELVAGSPAIGRGSKPGNRNDWLPDAGAVRFGTTWLTPVTGPQAVATVPAAPSALNAAAASSSQINLSWSDNANNETGFKIDYATNSSFSGFITIAVNSPNTTAYNVTGLVAGTLYYFRVRATNAIGDGANSGTASAATQPAGTAPAAPSGLTATAVSANQINLSWTDNAGNETGFEIDYATNSALTGATQVNINAANTNSYGVTGLAASTQYYFRVRATNAIGDSTSSAVAVATTATGTGGGAVVVQFDSPTDMANNFVATFAGGTYNQVSSGGSPGGYAYWNDPTGQRVSLAYDSTPTDRNASTHSRFGGGTSVENYSLDFRQSDYGDSIGITARMNDTGTAGYAAYMTTDSGDKRLRIAEVTGVYGRSLGADVADVKIAGDGFVNPILPNTWYTLQLSVQNVGSTVVTVARILNASSGAVLFATPIYTDSTSPATSAGQVGIRLQANTLITPNEIQFDTFKTLASGAPTVPSAPTSLAATVASSNQINLTWADTSNNEIGFEVDYSTSSAFTGATTINLGTPNTTSHNVTGLAASTQYYFRVRSTNAVGDSANSNTVNATTNAASGGGSVAVNFESSGDFSSKFVPTYTGGTYTQVTSGGSPGGYQRWTDATGQSVTVAYDSTPADRNPSTHSKFGGGTAVETYGLDFRQSDLGDSIGVTARVNDNGTAGYVAYMNTDSGDKYLRVAKVTGNYGRSFGSTLAQIRIGGDGFVNPILPNTWYRLQLQVQNVGGTTQLIARIVNPGTGTVLFATAVYTDSTTPALAAGQAGIRLQGNTPQQVSNEILFDTFTVA